MRKAGSDVPEVETRQGALENPDDYRPRRRYLEERAKSPNDRQSGPSYYDIPMLKPHAWTPEVTIYFFLGGVSVGAFVLSRLGERMGGAKFRDLTRAGAYVSAAAVLPCAPLLITDLGDPKRFHHMLRVFKPSSPMNLGTWVLTAFTPIVLVAALREWVFAHPPSPSLPVAVLVPRSAPSWEGESKTVGSFGYRIRRRWDSFRLPLPGRSGARNEHSDWKGGGRGVGDTLLTLALDALGLPLGLLLATYTGVLISATAVPLWGRNPHLGSLFMTSAMNTGAAAVHLALEATGNVGEAHPELGHALDRIDVAAHAVEARSGAVHPPCRSAREAADARRAGAKLLGRGRRSGPCPPRLARCDSGPAESEAGPQNGGGGGNACRRVRASLGDHGSGQNFRRGPAGRAGRVPPQKRDAAEGHRPVKVRWTEDSLRLRITPTELETLLRDGPVTETLTFAGSFWSVTIQPCGSSPSCFDASGGIICFLLGDADRDRLAAPESEGIYFAADKIDTDGIRTTIEKDFPCVHPRAIEANEPPTEAFVPPPDFEARKLAP